MFTLIINPTWFIIIIIIIIIIYIYIYKIIYYIVLQNSLEAFRSPIRFEV